ncbi:MAG: hypothetical protein QXJ86_05705 [Nitrososphaerales archaeon]
MSEEEAEESVFHKKLKVKLKAKGKEGKIIFLKEYLEFLLKNNRTLPPDFPTFCREVMGLDERNGTIHIKIWNERNELVEFVRSMNYDYRIDQYD